MAEVKIEPGMFSWVDLATSDASVVVPFYEKVFGWTTEEVEGGAGPYWMFMRGEVAAAGLGELSDEMKAAGAPSFWNSYIQVESVADTFAKASELGGTVLVPPMAVGEMGHFTVIQDPTGAAISFWQSEGDVGSGNYNEAGLLAWNELVTRDPDAARTFYEELLGWEWDEMAMPQGPYLVAKNAGRSNGGVMQMTDEWPAEVPSHWMVYFGTDDVDATTEAARAAGGTVHVEPMDIAVGRFASLADPTGAPFTVFKGGDM